MCQGKRALGLLQKEANQAAQINPPKRKAQRLTSTKFASQTGTKPPIPEANPNRNKAITTLINPQTTFKTGVETLLNGVI